MDDERSGTEDTGPSGIPRPRWHPLEVAFWIAPIPAFFVLSDRRQFLSQVFIYAIFALSLDLILGYAGILSLGHAAFFGVGAYTAGLLARHGWVEPVSGLGVAALVAGAFGYAVSFLVVPGADPILSVDEYRLIERQIPDCEFVVYEGMPHNITDEVPDRCAKELRRFLLKQAAR